MPTPAVNYKKEPCYLLGMKTAVETPKGADRSGTDKDSNKWSVKLKADYGYINGTRGADKDHIDAFFGPEAANGDLPVHVIDQQNEDGSFDEHKVMLGYRTAEEATRAYHANYEPGFRGFADITPMKLGDFKAWAFAPGPRNAPAAELNFAGGGLVKALAAKTAPFIVKAPATDSKVMQRLMNMVKSSDDLGHPDFASAGVDLGPYKSQPTIPGYHMTQDLEALLRSGKIDNTLAPGNMQGYLPDVLGGAYFYSNPKLAAAQRLRAVESAEQDVPILKVNVPRKGLRSDEDTGQRNWSKSYAAGSFATAQPVPMYRTEAIYTGSPDNTKDLIQRVGRDVRLKYADGGLVQTFKDKLWGTKEERQAKLAAKVAAQQLQPVERLSTYTNGTATAERMKAVDKYAAGGLVQAYGARK